MSRIRSAGACDTTRFAVPAVRRTLLRGTSPLALALMAAAGLGASSERAEAANECGAPVAGAVTCSGNNYPSPGISYTSVNGLTLTLDNPNLVTVKTTTGQGAVHVSSSGTNTNDIVVNALRFQSAQTSGILSNGIGAVNTGTAGNAVIRMDTGTASASGNGLSNGLVATIGNSVGTGNALITLNGGQVINTGNGTTTGIGNGVSAQNAGTGNAGITMTGGSVSVTNPAITNVNGLPNAVLRALVTNTASSGSASVDISGGTVTAGSGRAVLSQSERGNAGITMTGGAVTVQSGASPALSAVVNNAAGTGTASIAMSGGTVVNNGSGHGLFANNRGTGTYSISVTGGTVTGGSGTGAAIHGDAAAGGTIAIGADAVVNAGASGIALSQTSGAATITTAGAVTGNINLGAAANTLTVTGGAIDGNISGGGNSALNFDLGSGSFAYGAPYTINGMASVAMTSGTARIDGALNTNTLAVNGGTLQIAGTASAAGSTTVSGGTLRVDGTLTSDTFAVTGGNATIAGTATAATGTTVSGGTLAVNGVLTGTVLVSGGRLQGTGTVGATTVASGGRIAPGSSIGTLTVNGAYVQNAGSVYEVELDPGTVTSDRIQVNGTATLANGATISITNYTGAAYVAGQRYTILTSTGLTGSYGSADYVLTPFLSLRNSTDATNAYLTVVQTRTVASVGTTPNEVAVGTGIDSLPSDHTVKAEVTSTPTVEAARGALGQLGGEIHASAKTALIEESWLLRSAVNDRLRAAFGAVGAAPMATLSYGFTADLAPAVKGPMPRLPSAERFAVWGQGYGAFGRTDSGATAGMSRSTGGFVFGADAAAFDTLRFGVVAGYSRTTIDVDRRLSSGESDNYHLGLYGGGQWGALNLRLGASYTWHDLSTRRSVVAAGLGDTLRADRDAGTAQLFGELGYRIELGQHALGRVALEPFAGLAYVNLRSDGLNERGGASALAGTGEDTSLGYATLGLRAATTTRLQGMDLTLRGTLGWRHAFGEVDPKATLAFAGSIPFTIAGAPIARNAALVEAGLDLAIAANMMLGASYAGQLASDAQDHAFKANLAVRF